MNRCNIKVSLISLIIFLLLPVMSFSDDPTAEKPIYSEGDFWVLVNRNKSKEVKYSFLREEEDRVVCKLDESDRTRDLYFKAKIKRLPVGYPDPIIDFPLTVGKKWNYQFQQSGGQQHPMRAQYKVEAFESVTVPGGTFQAFRITAITESTDLRVNKAPDKDQYWYCPDVRYIVKRINPKGDIWELQSYAIK